MPANWAHSSYWVQSPCAEGQPKRHFGGLSPGVIFGISFFLC
jgi:hypothetical protein